MIEFSKELWNGKDFFKNEFPYIEISEIDTSSGCIKNIIFVPKDEAPSRAKMIIRNDDLIVSTTRPSRGAISFIQSHETEIQIASTGFCVLRNLKSNLILKKYLFYALRQDFSLKQMEQRSSGGNYPAIAIEELKKIKIPIPSLETQKNIVAIFETAYNSKKQKEAEASELLASIDNYLLEQLGITLPPQTEKKTSFITDFNKLSGGRFDPSFYEPRVQKSVTALNNSCYPIKTLKEISELIFQGVSQNLTNDNSIILLKVKNILENNNIDFENVEFVKYAPEKKVLQKGDIITPFIGEAIRKIKFSVFPFVDKKYTVDNNTGVIRLNKNVSPYYVASFLATKVGAWQIERLIGGGVPFIGSANASKLIIPLPPLEKQEAIAAHINEIRAKAKHLQHQAAETLEQAKQHVEKMILG